MCIINKPSIDLHGYQPGIMWYTHIPVGKTLIYIKLNEVNLKNSPVRSSEQVLVSKEVALKEQNVCSNFT